MRVRRQIYPQNFHQISALGHHTNSLQPSTQLTTRSGVTFLCYINDQLQVVVAGSVDLVNWAKQIVGTVQDDAHNGCAIGLDPWGYIWCAFDMHDSTSFSGHLVRSANPFDVNSPFLARNVVTSPVPFSISYPVFYSAGGEFYLLFRCGTSGAGDTWMLRLSAIDTWSIVAAPLLAGRPGSISPIDNQYPGNAWAEGNGNLHLTWTNRIGWQNVGVSFAYFDCSTSTFRNSSGQVLSLPLTRNNQENILSDGYADQSISNSGLSTAKTVNGVLHVGFNRLSSGGFREIFYARKLLGVSSPWTIRQISNATEMKVRISPCSPPNPSLPSPCDMEVMGPIILARQSDSQIALIWSVASGTGVLNAWSRPPGKLYISRTIDGSTWTTDRIIAPIDLLTGELSRETLGALRLLYQSLDGKNENKPIYVVNLADYFNDLIDGVDGSGVGG